MKLYSNVYDYAIYIYIYIYTYIYIYLYIYIYIYINYEDKYFISLFAHFKHTVKTYTNNFTH